LLYDLCNFITLFKIAFVTIDFAIHTMLNMYSWTAVELKCRELNTMQQNHPDIKSNKKKILCALLRRKFIFSTKKWTHFMICTYRICTFKTKLLALYTEVGWLDFGGLSGSFILKKEDFQKRYFLKFWADFSEFS
jgi:hypothetical protein